MTTGAGWQWVAPAALGIALLLSACSESSPPTIFEPDIGHAENWIVSHGQAALSEGNTCPECHGPDLGGGASEVSCFTSREKGATCHESGTGKRHTAGWSLESEHGRAAKERPGISSGFGSCQACHGSDYGGGTSDVSCSSCHGVSAPHPGSPWFRSPNSHASAHEQNAPFCAECHLDPKSDQPAGCFNGSLCHGEKGIHLPGWEKPEQHGAEAKEDPQRGGFAGCQECHGTDYSGGTAGLSCSSCHEVAAPHPLSWEGGSESHRDTDEGNVGVCAGCHREVTLSGGCFSANACHGSSQAPPESATGDPEEEPGASEPAP